MQITKVKYKEHPILWDLEIDFLNQDTWIPYDTIIFAGENGTWKTTILESLSIFLSGWTFEYFDYIEYLVDWEILKAINYDAENPSSYYKIRRGHWVEKNMTISKNTLNKELDNSPINIRLNWCVFSKARADYKTKKIQSTTTKDLDLEKYDLDEEDNFTTLKQLLVDIQSQDDEAYSSINRSSKKSISWEKFYPKSKTYRFKEAFNNVKGFFFM